MKIFEQGGKPIKAWINGVELEDEAKHQLINISKMPFIHKHIAVMPDVHCGKGATVGSVIATKGAIIPAAVGVDIGCGMLAVKTSLIAGDLPDNLFSLRTAIEKVVPHGRTDNSGQNDRGAWKEVSTLISDSFNQVETNLTAIIDKHKILKKPASRAIKQLGTLGTGNYFIELCLDEANNLWVMLHSGSRGIGNAIGNYFIEKAKKDMQRWFIKLPDKDLSYLSEGSTNFNDYIFALHWAQSYALLNRKIMMSSVINTLSNFFTKPFKISE